MQLHIVRVTSKSATRKDGTPVLTKSGKPLFSVGILTTEYGDKWLNGLMPFNPDRWANSVQELEVSERDYKGKKYLDFKLPPRDDRGPAAASPATSELKNILTLQVIPLLHDLTKMITAIHEREKLAADGYPQMDDTNDAHGLDNISENNPFV